jgi:hypothetical protein
MIGPAIRQLCADACFLLNLVATGRGKEILEGVDLRLVSHREVMSEALYLVEWDAEGRRLQAPVDLHALAPLLESRDLTAAGRGVLVAAAEYLTDRDARTVALAVQAGLPLATDDRRIRRIVALHFPELHLVSTLELLKDATERMKLSTAEVGDLLRRLRDRGNFAPPRDDPPSGWYSDALFGRG